jgi:hypothetical protein
MINASVLLVASLATMQSGNDYWPSVSCNKQGTAFDSVWQNGGTIYHQRNTNGTAPSDANGTALPSFSLPGSVSTSISAPTYMPPASVDTDDSSTTPNFAVTWCVTSNFASPNPSITIPCCSVNGHSPFAVGYNTNTQSYVQAAEAWVAVSRQLATYNGEQVMVVSVASQYGLGTVYVQEFLVSPSNGTVVTQSNPVQVNSNPSGSLALGGISGDDYGNFVVSYVRQSAEEGQHGQISAAVLVAGYNYKTIFNNPPTLGFGEYQVVQLVASDNPYTWCRVACYHGSSADSGGFVVAYSGPALTAYRFTTNWSSAPTFQKSVTYSGMETYLPSSESQTAWWHIACVRDTPGDYILTWGSTLPSPPNSEQLNSLYGMVTNDVGGGVQYMTDYAGNEYNPPHCGLTPNVAVSDHSSGALFQVDYCYSKSLATTGSITAGGTAIN